MSLSEAVALLVFVMGGIFISAAVGVVIGRALFACWERFFD